jgi:uncharacterized protein
MTDVEIRSLDTEELEFRAADPSEGKVGTFSGFAARYNSPSLPLPFTERIAPGAFARTLKSRNDVRMYVNHDDRMVLASTRAKTLRLEDRAEGLWAEADLPDTSYAHDLRSLIERGDVRTMSFGFSTVKSLTRSARWSPATRSPMTRRACCRRSWTVRGQTRPPTRRCL